MNQIIGLPALKDNYIWLYPLSNTLNNKSVIVIDPGESKPVLDYCDQHQVKIDSILLTHHHADHIDGALAIAKRYNAPIYASDEVPLPHISVNQLNQFERQNHLIQVIPVPGHTLQHVAYLINGHLFSGDTLFSAGCGRIFEGTYEMMFDSLNRLKQLPDKTLVYAGHEYTRSNLEFAKQMDPDNPLIQHTLLTLPSCSLPSTIEKEKQINVFFYSDFTRLKQKYDCLTDLELFTFLRKTKNDL